MAMIIKKRTTCKESYMSTKKEELFDYIYNKRTTICHLTSKLFDVYKRNDNMAINKQITCLLTKRR